MPDGGTYLLDTGVLIIYARGKEAAGELERQFQLTQAPFKPVVSVVTVGEVGAFARWRKWSERNLARLHALLSNLVVLDISIPQVLQAYAETAAACLRNGWAMGNNDLWIAATAHVTGLTLLTTDKDFDPLVGTVLGRVLLDPRTGRPA